MNSKLDGIALVVMAIAGVALMFLGLHENTPDDRDVRRVVLGAAFLLNTSLVQILRALRK